MAGTGNRQTLAADGQTDPKIFIGPVRLSLTGSFGAGTEKLQCKDPSGEFIDIASGSFAAAADAIFDFPITESNELQVDLAGATAPALVVWIQGNELGLS